MSSKPPSYTSAMNVDRIEGVTQTPSPPTAASNTINFEDCKISFAIDHSGSTRGSVLEYEKSAIRTVSILLSGIANAAVRILPWSSEARNPIRLIDLEHLDSYAGTSPQSLLANSLCRQRLQTSDIWFLLTDGQISNRSVKQFAHRIAQHGLHGIACVIVIFGPARGNPATCDISVGVSVFAAVPDCLFLFFDTVSQQLYILQCSGRFTQILEVCNEDQPILEETTLWADLPKIKFSDLSCVSVRTPVKLSPDELLLPDGFLINLKDLWSGSLNDADTIDRIFQDDDNLKSIMLTAQTRDEVREFQNWLKPFLNDVTSPLREGPGTGPGMGPETIASVRQVIEEMKSGASGERLEELQRNLRTSYALESESQSRDSTYNRRRSSQAAFERSLHGGANRARALSSVVASERPSRSSGTRNMQALIRHLKTPGFSKPDGALDMFKGQCSLCRATNVNLVLLLRSPPAGSVTDGFPAPNSATELTCPLVIGNFPETDIISSSICCDTCSFYLAKGGRTPLGEELKCVLPLVTYAINQAAYRRELRTALDNRFHEHDLIQIFLAIVINTFQRLPSKKSFDINRNALKWMCKDILIHYLCPANVFSSSRDGSGTDIRAARMLSIAITSSFKSLYQSLTTQATAISSAEAEDLFSYPLLGFVVMIVALQLARISMDLPLGVQNIIWQRFLFQLVENYYAIDGSVDLEKDIVLFERPSAKMDVDQDQSQATLSAPSSNSDEESSLRAVTASNSILDTLVTRELLTEEELRDFRLLGEQFDWIEKKASPAIDLFLMSLSKIMNKDKTPWEIFDALRREKELKKVFEEPLGVCLRMNTVATPLARASSPEWA